MALGYVGSTSDTGTSNGYTVSLASLSGGLYTTPKEGDIVIVCTAFGNTAASAPTVTGDNNGAYTAFEAASHVNDTWDTEFLMAYKVMGATPDTSITIARTTNAAYGGGTVVHVWTGQHRTLPFNVSPATVTASNTSLGDPPSVTASVTGCVAIACGAGTQGTTGSAFTVPALLTDNIVSINADGSTSDIGVWIASKPVTSGVAFDPGAWSGGSTSASSSCATRIIALRPRAADFYSLGLDSSDYAVYTLTGQNATLTYISGSSAVVYSLVCSAGSYTLTGQAQLQKITRPMPAAAGSYSYTGNAATLTYRRNLVASAGSYTLTGQAAVLKRVYSLVCSAGSYTLTGQAQLQKITRLMPAAPGAYTYTGAASTLKYIRTLTAGAGSYALTGVDCNLKVTRRLVCAAGNYAVSGVAATLTYQAGSVPAVIYSLTCSAGAYTFAGVSANLRVTHRLICDAGTYSLTGQAASLKVTRRLTASAGNYLLTGQPATLTYIGTVHYSLICEAGSYALTGRAATLTHRQVVINPKVGGDDAPERVEIYEKRKKAKPRDFDLDKLIKNTIAELTQEAAEPVVVEVSVQNDIPPVITHYDPVLMSKAIRGEKAVFEPIKFVLPPPLIVVEDNEEDDVEVLLLLH